MIIGVLSDTHKDNANALPHIMREFHNRGAEMIIHCGDIEAKHLKPELFLNLPVICAITKEQKESGKSEFKNPPQGWIFTFPEDRVRFIEKAGVSVYVGHRRSFEFLAGSEEKLMQMMHQLRRDHNYLRWIFSGHTHHQILSQTLPTNFVNPGAVEDSFDGYEFAVINTGNYEVVFSRILTTRPTIQPFSVGIISDSANISEMDPNFWKKLAEEFKLRNVGWVIHCGNMKTDDIDRPELANFEVHYNLHPNQRPRKKTEVGRWYQIPHENPIVEIKKYRFYIWHDLGATLLDQSEMDMHKICLKLRQRYPDLSFVLCGLTNNASLEEGQQVRIVNPGDVIQDRSFCVVCLPQAEITYGHVPVDPLPELKPLAKADE